MIKLPNGIIVNCTFGFVIKMYVLFHIKHGIVDNIGRRSIIHHHHNGSHTEQNKSVIGLRTDLRFLHFYADFAAFFAVASFLITNYATTI